MSYSVIKKEDIDNVLVRTRDGRTYLAQYDTSRNLVPTRLLQEEELEQLTQQQPQQGGQGQQNGQGQGQHGMEEEPADHSFEQKVDSYKQKMLEQLGDAAQGQQQRANEAMDATTKWRSGKNVNQEESYQHPDKLPVLDDTVFRSRLSSIMTDNKYDRTVRGRTRGKLDMTRLFKAQTRSNSIFTQKQARKNKQYNIVLVVDESGSMIDERIEQAADTAVFLAKNFVGLNVDLAILGFNHFQYLHKDFGKRINDYEQLKSDIVHRAHDRGNGCTHDFDAIDRAYKLLANKKGQNFVVFISDGYPGSCGWVDAVCDPHHPMSKVYKEVLEGKAEEEDIRVKSRYVKEGNEKAELIMWTDTTVSNRTRFDRNDIKQFHHLIKANEHIADTIGIGIQRDCVQVPHNFTVNNIEDMKPKILEAVKKKIKRG